MRKPDFVIQPQGVPQTERWHLFKIFGAQVALHRWLLSDSDRALHDHQADNISILLWGSYREVFSHAWEPMLSKLRLPLVPYFRRAETPHRVHLHRGAPVWTIWIRFKPRRNWGFICSKGWVRWQDYVDSRDAGKDGKGCE